MASCCSKKLTERKGNMIKVSTQKLPTGEPWDCKEKSKIVKIFISHSKTIHSIQFVYVNDNGDLTLSERYGSERGDILKTVILNYPSEFLTSVGGKYDGSRNALTSIVFTTNIDRYGLFGSPERDDTEFNFDLGKDSSFGGFHGTTTKIGLESIGVYINPFTKKP
ncbi:hypothetical protein NMG60_11024997 [Bertholletia excelsa]